MWSGYRLFEDLLLGRSSRHGPELPPLPLRLSVRLHAGLVAFSVAVSTGNYDGTLSQMIRS